MCYFTKQSLPCIQGHDSFVFKTQGLFTVFKEWNKVECLQSAVSLASAAQYSPLSRRAAPTGGAVAESWGPVFVALL